MHGANFTKTIFFILNILSTTENLEKVMIYNKIDNTINEKIIVTSSSEIYLLEAFAFDQLQKIYDDFENGSIFDHDNVINIKLDDINVEYNDITTECLPFFEFYQTNPFMKRNIDDLNSSHGFYNNLNIVQDLLNYNFEIHKLKKTKFNDHTKDLINKDSNVEIKNLTELNIIHNVYETSNNQTINYLNKISKNIKISNAILQENIKKKKEVTSIISSILTNKKQQHIKHYLYLLIKKQSLFQLYFNKNDELYDTSFNNIYAGLENYLQNEIKYNFNFNKEQLENNGKITYSELESDKSKKTFENNREFTFNPYLINMSNFIKFIVFYNEIKKDFDNKLNREKHNYIIYNKEIFVHIKNFLCLPNSKFYNNFISLHNHYNQIKTKNYDIIQYDNNKIRLFLIYLFNFIDIQKLKIKLNLVHSFKHTIFKMFYLIYPLHKLYNLSEIPYNYIKNCYEVVTVLLLVNEKARSYMITCNEIKYVCDILNKKYILQKSTMIEFKKYKTILENIKKNTSETNLIQSLSELFQKYHKEIVILKSNVYKDKSIILCKTKPNDIISFLCVAIGYLLLGFDEKSIINKLKKYPFIKFLKTLQTDLNGTYYSILEILVHFSKSIIKIELLKNLNYILPKICKDVEVYGKKLIQEYKNLSIASTNDFSTDLKNKIIVNIDNIICDLDLRFFTIFSFQNFILNSENPFNNINK